MIDDPITITSRFCQKKDRSSGQDLIWLWIWSEKDLIVPNSGICRRREIFIIHSMGSIVKNSSWSWRGCKNEFLSLENRVKVACSKTNRTENPRLSLVVSLLVVSRNSFFSFGNVFSLLYFFLFCFLAQTFQRILIMKYTRRRRLWRVYQTFKN